MDPISLPEVARHVLNVSDNKIGFNLEAERPCVRMVLELQSKENGGPGFLDTVNFVDHLREEFGSKGHKIGVGVEFPSTHAEQPKITLQSDPSDIKTLQELASAIRAFRATPPNVS